MIDREAKCGQDKFHTFIIIKCDHKNIIVDMYS